MARRAERDQFVQGISAPFNFARFFQTALALGFTKQVLGKDMIMANLGFNRKEHASGLPPLTGMASVSVSGLVRRTMLIGFVLGGLTAVARDGSALGRRRC